MVSLIRAIKFKVWLLQTSIHSLSLPTQRRHTIYRHLGRQNAPIHNYKLFYILKYVLTCDDVFIFIKWQKKKKNQVCGSAGKESTCNAENLVWFLGGDDPLEKRTATHSSILENTGSLENPMDRGAWWATVLGVTKSQIQLSN